MRKTAILSILAVALFALVACGGNKSSNANSGSSSSSGADQSVASSAPMEQQGGDQGGAQGAAAGSIPNCGAVQAVWANLKSRVYHEPSDPLYGKTRHGEYLCPAEAKAQGFRPAGGGHHHHRAMNSSSSSDSSM